MSRIAPSPDALAVRVARWVFLLLIAIGLVWEIAPRSAATRLPANVEAIPPGP